MKRILVLRFSSIGDIVLTTPVVRALKTQLEDTAIHFATKKEYGVLFEANPYVDKVHFLDDSLSSLIQELRRERFDLIIDLHHNLRTFWIKQALRTKAISFNKLNFQKWLMVNMKINKLPNIHIVERYMETVKSLGVKMDALGLDYFIPEKDEVPMVWLPEDFRNGYVAYAIGAQHGTKKLPVNRMIELCDRINKPIILLGGKEDAATGETVVGFFTRSGEHNSERILKDLNKRTIIYNACGRFNLNQSASILRQARYVFTHDTGLMHIAAALKKETFTLWETPYPHSVCTPSGPSLRFWKTTGFLAVLVPKSALASVQRVILNA